MDNPFDGSAVQLVPQNVEKLPLWHWRPGARLLAIGSRDGASFDGAIDASEERSFRRELGPALLTAAQERAGTDGVFACWSESLLYPRSVAQLREHRIGVLAVATAGHGPADALEGLLDEVGAWVLMIGDNPGQHAAAIMRGGRHVEVVLGLPNTPPADLPWDAVAAVHVQAQRTIAAVGAELAAWEQAACAALPSALPCYGHGDNHTLCGCGATLVWRSSGRSRRDSLGNDGCCTACGAPSAITL
ncbi:MAG: hypothetical protein PF961_21130 [Planctomycetota bacterium]|jgi:hypothetical protein|nr:hypothetical protein [Planctomycetota bacterium]